MSECSAVDAHVHLFMVVAPVTGDRAGCAHPNFRDCVARSGLTGQGVIDGPFQ